MKKITIMDARTMSKMKLQTELGKHAKYLESLGMDHVEACQFASNIMNIGIALQENHDSVKISK